MDLFTDLFWQCFLNNAENPKDFLIKYLSQSLETASKNHYEETIGNLETQNSELKFQLDELNLQLDTIVEASIQKQSAQSMRRKTAIITQSSNESISNQPSKRRRCPTAYTINAPENDESCVAKQPKGNKKARIDEEYLTEHSDVATTSRRTVTCRSVCKCNTESDDSQT